MRKGKLRGNLKVQYLEERNLNGLISMCRGVFEPHILEKMKKVQRKVNGLLHSDLPETKKINHLEVIKDTFQILERIFE